MRLYIHIFYIFMYYIYSLFSCFHYRLLQDIEYSPLCMHARLLQLCPSLRDPVGCILPGFSVHGILQARILECVAISFSRGSSQPRDQTQVSQIAGKFFTI